MGSWITTAPLAVSLVVVLLVLLTNRTGAKRLQAGRRWQGYGIALELTGILSSALAEDRGWRAGRLQLVRHATDACVLAGVALLTIGLVIQFRVRVPRDEPAGDPGE